MTNYVTIAICVTVIIVALVCLIIVLLLRTELKDWMRRVLKIGSVELVAPPGQQQKVAVAERSQEQTLSVPANTPPTPGLALWQHEIDTVIERQNLRNSPDLANQLKLALALAVRTNDFHLAARLIFGTQIAALTLLNATPGGLTLEDLRHLFYEHQNRVHSAGLTYQTDILSWLNFLVTQKLVTFENGHYRLSAPGVDFLGFTAHLGITETKPY